MLERLSVRNYALIDELDVEFHSGFNILTGETGAGKSILIGALNLILGGKAEVEAIRTGAETAEVTASIRVDGNDEANKWLGDRDLAADDGYVLVRRTLKRAGRGGAFIQGSPAPLTDLQEFTSYLFDLHGQHDHQSLLAAEKHRKMIDRFAGLTDQTTRVADLYGKLVGLRDQYESFLSSEQRMAQEVDYLTYAVKEIDEAKLKPGEDEDLEHERNILNQGEKLFGALDSVYRAGSENAGGALASLRDALESARIAAGVDSSLGTLSERLEQSFFEAEDVIQTFREYQLGLEFSPERLEEVEQRLALIHRLEKKYGPGIAKVIEFMEDGQRRLSSHENREEEKNRLQEELRETEKNLLAKAVELSRQRKAAASRLTASVQEHLRTLGMPKAEFSAAFSQREGAGGRPVCGPSGIDRIEFMISANPGEPPKSLRKVASGGELSRIMLALKTVLAENDEIGSLIFDEIDSGIGGEVGKSLGEHMNKLGAVKQILCITHLASIAVFADKQFKVEKRTTSGRTISGIGVLKGEDRKIEIARMLSGDTGSDASLQHAQDLLEKYGVRR